MTKSNRTKLVDLAKSFCWCNPFFDRYTSLGSQHNTRPNQALKFTASNGEECYHPAYMLKDEDAERNGRH
ncbi:unnamed protein product [Timema podura]|uniref:Uncharacterized protein n=1 Tax=Timema podura TaxID=61482 RepID=A0ABN7NR17_TIMPD|nr:unnamed protein product [Timema podura]